VSALDTTNFVLYTDALGAALILAEGDSSGGCGDEDVEAKDDTGARGRLGDLEVALLNLEDGDYAPAIVTLQKSIAKAGYQSYAARAFADAVNALTTLCADAGIAGVASVDNFAKYHNTGAGGPWAALLAPQFRTVLLLTDGVTLNPVNVYAPSGALASRSITASVLSALTDTAAIDSAVYAGAARAQAVITGIAFASGITSSTVTVVGKARKADGTTADGRFWRGNLTANGTVTLTPDVAGDLLLDVTDIQFGAGLTAIAATINAAPPAGRTYPPQ
jgi:hypothetical protein